MPLVMSHALHVRMCHLLDSSMSVMTLTVACGVLPVADHVPVGYHKPEPIPISP